MEVYVVIELKSEDYHGTYKEVIDVYASEDCARKACEILNRESSSCDIEYDWDVYNLK